MTIRDVAIRTFFICGYILLYAVATVFAGIFTLVGFWVAKKVLQLTMGKRIIPWRNHIEFTRGLCVLVFCTLYLIVAVGLLFMHLTGGLPDEYDEIAAQVGIAAFGILVLMVMCLLIFFTLAFAMWAWHRITQNDDVLLEANEETGLLKGKVYRIYGCKDPRHRLFDDDEDDHHHHAGVASEDEDDGKDQDEVDGEEDAVDDDVKPSLPNRTWMRLSRQSSVRNLDLRRMTP